MSARSADDAANADLAIIGGGIAGGVIAAAAARAGMRVLVLERTTQHEDRVRGEFMPPWGVQEAAALGDIFLSAGSNWVRRSVGHGEDIAPTAAESRPIHLDQLLPGVDGALTFGHPQVCTALNNAAVPAGATLLRGVTDVEVTPGSPPTRTFGTKEHRHTMRPRLVAADGRGSRTARLIRAEPHTEKVEHLLCGLLVDGAPGWPQDQMTIGTEGELVFYVFPQGGGRIRTPSRLQPSGTGSTPTGPGEGRRGSHHHAAHHGDSVRALFGSGGSLHTRGA